jgi:hypothetical protein
MAEVAPAEYVASKVSTELPSEMLKAPEPPKPKIEGDPLKSFEYYHFQVQSDLRNWMTFAKPDRIEKAKRFSNVADEERYRIDPDRRHKILNYIMWLESIHSLGDRDVAAVAFNGLFPKTVDGRS